MARWFSRPKRHPAWSRWPGAWTTWPGAWTTWPGAWTTWPQFCFPSLLPISAETSSAREREREIRRARVRARASGRETGGGRMAALKPLDMGRAIRDTNLSSLEKQTLHVLVLRVTSATSRGPVSLEKLAQDASISKRSVQRAIKGLVEKGLVKVKKRFVNNSGPRICNEYELSPENSEAWQAVNRAKVAKRKASDGFQPNASEVSEPAPPLVSTPAPSSQAPAERHLPPSAPPVPLSVLITGRASEPSSPQPKAIPKRTQDEIERIRRSLTDEERADWDEIRAIPQNEQTREQRKRVASLMVLVDQRSCSPGRAT